LRGSPRSRPAPTWAETGLLRRQIPQQLGHAIQDTRTLRLRREPLIALARQHPDLSLELINVLGVACGKPTTASPI